MAWHPGWVFAGAVLEAGVIMSLNDWRDARKIQEIKMEGAAYFKKRCESHTDFPQKAHEIMQYEMDNLLDKTQGKSR